MTLWWWLDVEHVDGRARNHAVAQASASAAASTSAPRPVLIRIASRFMRRRARASIRLRVSGETSSRARSAKRRGKPCFAASLARYPPGAQPFPRLPTLNLSSTLWVACVVHITTRAPTWWARLQAMRHSNDSVFSRWPARSSTAQPRYANRSPPHTERCQLASALAVSGQRVDMRLIAPQRGRDARQCREHPGCSAQWFA